MLRDMYTAVGLQLRKVLLSNIKEILGKMDWKKSFFSRDKKHDIIWSMSLTHKI